MAFARCPTRRQSNSGAHVSSKWSRARHGMILLLAACALLAFYQHSVLRAATQTHDWSQDTRRVLPRTAKQALKYAWTDAKYRIYSLNHTDVSPRCQHSGICDGDNSPGPDELGNVTDNRVRVELVRVAATDCWKTYM